MVFVFSGGGVCGVVYVGVFEVLEVNGVMVDCIVGMSMGLIVGGLYVVGWVLRVMVLEFEFMDWNDVFDDLLLCK